MPDIVFADSETRSPADLLSIGAYKYAHHPETDASVWSYAFDDEHPKIWSPRWAWGNVDGIRPDVEEPTDLLDHIENGGYFVAWNAFFDRWIWNAVMVPKYGWPELRRDQVLCAQAQAEANNLPGKLAKACECLGTHYQKDPHGIRLINLLSMGTRDTWDSEKFETGANMGHFRAYCAKDVMAMRDVWQHTRPLTAQEWAEYHASERVNDNGVAVDHEFAQAAQRYARAESADINKELAELTGDPRLTITAHLRKAKWLHDQLWPDEEIQAMAKRPPKKDKERFAADRSTRGAVIEALTNPDHAALFEEDHRQKIIDFIELVEAGNSAAVNKFKAIANYAHEGRVHGQYSFNGAGQTGRFSSRGVQVHNLIRDPVKKKHPNRAVDAIEDIMDGTEPEYLVDTYGYPVSRLLARLIRPTFIASEGKTLVWADWDQIEARVLPWLANSAGSKLKLDLFQQGQDVYKYAAAPIFGLNNPLDATEEQRQIGKVAELALGFGGAVGAFSAMGRGYGVIVPENEARRIVDTWRATNGWCVAFWGELWDAAIAAYKNPATWFHVGRVKYLYHPQLMRGTLICALPDGRWIVYPQFKREWTTWEDKDGNAREGFKTTFVRGFGSGYGRVDLWYGILAENITQGTAASFLRRAVVDLCDDMVLHTHDECVLEVPDNRVEEAKERLRTAMTSLPDTEPWAAGLPLSVSIESGPFYTK